MLYLVDYNESNLKKEHKNETNLYYIGLKAYNIAK